MKSVSSPRLQKHEPDRAYVNRRAARGRFANLAWCTCIRSAQGSCHANVGTSSSTRRGLNVTLLLLLFMNVYAVNVEHYKFKNYDSQMMHSGVFTNLADYGLHICWTLPDRRQKTFVDGTFHESQAHACDIARLENTSLCQWFRTSDRILLAR